MPSFLGGVLVMVFLLVAEMTFGFCLFSRAVFLRRAVMVFYILFSLCVREKLDKSRFSLFIVILSVSYGMIHGP